MESQDERRPIIVPNGEHPAFVFEDFLGEDLLCSACQQCVLVRGYSAAHLVGIQIRCARCGAVTTTPDLEPGEVFPQQLVVLPAAEDSDRRYLVGSPILGHRDVVMTSDQQAKQSLDSSRPRSENFRPMSLSVDGISEIEQRYDDLTEGDFGRQLQSVNRSLIAQNQNAGKDHPVPWACSRLRNCLATGVINLDSHADYVALCTVAAFVQIVGVWGHNPRFRQIARNWRGAGTFWHDVFQLATASYLFEAGNRIGLGLPVLGQPSPDLYVRTAALEKIFVEVKSPRALGWFPENSFDESQVIKAVRTSLMSSTRQINRVRRGIIAIACCGDGEAFAQDLSRIVGQVLKAKGRDRRGVAAMVSITMLFPRRQGNELSPLGFRFERELNPFFEGPKQIVIGRGR